MQRIRDVFSQNRPIDRHIEKVIDYSDNTIPATAAGYPGMFEKTDARYVRVNVVKSNGKKRARLEVRADTADLALVGRVGRRQLPATRRWFDRHAQKPRAPEVPATAPSSGRHQE